MVPTFNIESQCQVSHQSIVISTLKVYVGSFIYRKRFDRSASAPARPHSTFERLKGRMEPPPSPTTSRSSAPPPPPFCHPPPTPSLPHLCAPRPPPPYAATAAGSPAAGDPPAAATAAAVAAAAASAPVAGGGEWAELNLLVALRVPPKPRRFFIALASEDRRPKGLPLLPPVPP